MKCVHACKEHWKTMHCSRKSFKVIFYVVNLQLVHCACTCSWQSCNLLFRTPWNEGTLINRTHLAVTCTCICKLLQSGHTTTSICPKCVQIQPCSQRSITMLQGTISLPEQCLCWGGRPHTGKVPSHCLWQTVETYTEIAIILKRLP